MKKLILILLTLSLTVGLFVGCSPSDEPADGDNELKLPNEQLPDEDAGDTNEQLPDEDADDTNDQEAPDNTPEGTPDASIEREISNKDFEAFYFSEVAPKQVKIELSNEGAGGDIGFTGDETTMYWETLYANGLGSFFLKNDPDLYFEFEPYFDELHKKIGYDIGKVPMTYYMIRALNIEIETFIEINDKSKAALDRWYASNKTEPGFISYTDEEIDLLYYGTYQDALEMHKYPTAIVVGNSIYSYRDLRLLAQQNKLADTGIAREDFLEHIEKANDKVGIHLRYFTADKLESAAAQLKTRAELGIVTPPPAVTE